MKKYIMFCSCAARRGAVYTRAHTHHTYHVVLTSEMLSIVGERSEPIGQVTLCAHALRVCLDGDVSTISRARS